MLAGHPPVSLSPSFAWRCHRFCVRCVRAHHAARMLVALCECRFDLGNVKAMLILRGVPTLPQGAVLVAFAGKLLLANFLANKNQARFLNERRVHVLAQADLLVVG